MGLVYLPTWIVDNEVHVGLSYMHPMGLYCVTNLFNSNHRKRLLSSHSFFAQKCCQDPLFGLPRHECLWDISPQNNNLNIPIFWLQKHHPYSRSTVYHTYIISLHEKLLPSFTSRRTSHPSKQQELQRLSSRLGQLLMMKNEDPNERRKKTLTFQFTGWLIGILITVCYNIYIYNGVV